MEEITQKATPDHRLVRIKPSVKREVHVLAVDGASYPVKKEAGWVKLPLHVADVAENEPVLDTDPDGPKVFDVKDAGQARDMQRAETKKADLAGTPDQPKDVTPITTDQPDVDLDSPAARRQRRRTGT